jgi:hypothetical protein
LADSRAIQAKTERLAQKVEEELAFFKEHC